MMGRVDPYAAYPGPDDMRLARIPWLSEIYGTAAFGWRLGAQVEPGQMVNSEGCGSVRALRFAKARIARRGLEIPHQARGRYGPGGRVDLMPGRWVAMHPETFDVLLDEIFSSVSPPFIGASIDFAGPIGFGRWVKPLEIIPRGSITALEPGPRLGATVSLADLQDPRPGHTMRQMIRRLDDAVYARRHHDWRQVYPPPAMERESAGG
jgi:hypothetical protein